jgi:hypothetical protein
MSPKTYRIFYAITEYAYADIEADSLREACYKADKMDGEEFKRLHDASWDIDHTAIAECEENQEVLYREPTEEIS